jgi:hypothetical protein
LPKTGLTIRHSLGDEGHSDGGFRSKPSTFELTWTILDLQRTPPPSRCCHRCNPELVVPFAVANKRDPRLTTFSNNFIYGLAPTSRPGSSASTRTNESQTSTFTAVRRGVKMPQEEQEKLRRRLIDWRNEKHRQQGSPIFYSAQIILPPKQINSFVTQSNRFLQEQIITPRLLRKLVPWDSATDSDLDQIVSIITDWRDAASIIIPSTPTSQRRARKKGRPGQEELTTPRAAPIPQPRFMSRFRLPAGQAGDENVFQNPTLHPTLPRAHQTPRPSPLTHPTPRPTPRPVTTQPSRAHQTPQPSPMMHLTSMAHPYQHTHIPPYANFVMQPQAPAGVSSPAAPPIPYNPYHHLISPGYIPSPLYFSSHASAPVSQSTAPATPPAQYHYMPYYTPSYHR